MFERYKSAFKKILITLGILSVYKIAMLISLPGVDLSLTAGLAQKEGFIKALNFFAGGGMEKCSILALGIMPYITSTIIVQILSSSVGLDYFKNIKKEREMGSAKLNTWTQYFTAIVAVLNAVGFTISIYYTSFAGKNLVTIGKALFFTISIPCLVAGAMLVLWLANQISKYGVENGTSVIVFANIISTTSGGIGKMFHMFKDNLLPLSSVLIVAGFVASVFLFVVFVESSTRYILVRYLGFRGSQISQNMPLRINNAGVIPTIIASALAHLPQMMINFLNKIGLKTAAWSAYTASIMPGGIFYYVFYSLLLFWATISYSEITFDVNEIARNLQERGAIVLNVRPGSNTAKYLSDIMSKLNFIAGCYLIIICVLCDFMCLQLNAYMGLDILYLGGPSIFIIVTTARQVYMGAANYEYQSKFNTMKSGSLSQHQHNSSFFGKVKNFFGNLFTSKRIVNEQE